MLKNIVKVVLCAFLAATCGMASAQQGQQNPMDQPLPLMANPMTGQSYVKSGVLPNGLSYYILHNAEPKGRANFYIAQKVGSTLENPQQLGLAHFLEHMAFNGTENYPGHKMLDYLQSKSLRFGADINAYTGFDETVYNIDNVPTADAALMDSVLLVLRDWSCAITLDGKEIDEERKVIQEEWRMRNDSRTRFFTAVLPFIYQEYQYQQMPIGSMDIVMNFPYKDLRDYYHKWYRPDQQGIIIVGDFDAEAMEKKVVDLFTPIKMPENAAPRVYPNVSDNKEPIYFEYEDAEAPMTSVSIAFKQDATPFEERNTIGYWMNDVTETLVTTMIDQRLQEFSQKPECEYSNAGVYFGDYYVSKTKYAFNIDVEPKDNDIAKATSQAMEIVARACQTGFTDSELQRAKDELMSRFEARNNERNTTSNSVKARQLIRHFIDNQVLAGPEIDLQLFQMISSQLTTQVLNPMVKGLLTDTNQVIVVFMPKKEGLTMPGRKPMIAAVENAINKKYEAYKDEVITEPLIAKLPTPGKVTATKNNAALGTTEFTLSNGAKVILKTTDFKSDEIRFRCVANGGIQTVNPKDKKAVDNLSMLNTAVESSKLGNFNNTMMSKFLSGKQVAVTYNFGLLNTGLRGSSVKKDAKTMMELIYSYFTQLNPDPEQYAIDLKKTVVDMERSQNDPMKSFSDSLVNAMYGNDPRMTANTVAKVQSADYAQMLNMAKNTMANAADYTFVFVGNIDQQTLQPLLEQYIATLPSKGKASKAAKIYPVSFYTGNTTVSFDKAMATPGTTYYSFTSGPVAVDAVSDIDIELAGAVLNNMFTEIIREKEGAAYSPGAAGRLDENNKRWELISVIQTNREQQDKAFKLANEELDKILAGDITPDQFNKVKTAAINQYDIQLRNNNFWLTTILQSLRGIDTYTGHKEALQNLTLQDLQKWLKGLNHKNTVTVIMTGVPEKK